jgi:hypothetical protein
MGQCSGMTPDEVTRIGWSSDESSVVCQSLPRTGEAEMRPEQAAEKGVMR